MGPVLLASTPQALEPKPRAARLLQVPVGAGIQQQPHCFGVAISSCGNESCKANFILPVRVAVVVVVMVVIAEAKAEVEAILAVVAILILV